MSSVPVQSLRRTIAPAVAVQPLPVLLRLVCSVRNSSAATAAKELGRVLKHVRAAAEVAVGVGVMARIAAAVRVNCAFCRKRRLLTTAPAVAVQLPPAWPRLACSLRNSNVATAAKVPGHVQRLVVPAVEAVEAVLATAKTAPAAMIPRRTRNL